MEGLYGNNSSKVPKFKALSGDVSPTINAQRDNQQFFIGRGRYHQPPKSPSFDSYASAGSTNLENVDSPLIKYLCSASPSAGDAFKTPIVDAAKYRPMIGHQYHGSNSTSSGSSGFGSRGSSSGSPLSAVENLETAPSRSPPVFNTPVKVEEDVLVMDGILVGSVPGARVRSSSSSSDSGGSSSSGSNSFYKTETCRSWHDSGTCRYGFKCQFAHGKEELRPTRFPNKSESQTCKSYTNSGSCTYGSKCRFVHHQVTTAASPTEPAVALAKTRTVSPIKLKQGTFTSTDWSPQDDGIEVALPSSASTDKTPSREDIDACIHDVLYGPIRRNRLPVFAEICPQ